MELGSDAKVELHWFGPGVPPPDALRHAEELACHFGAPPLDAESALASIKGLTVQQLLSYTRVLIRHFECMNQVC